MNTATNTGGLVIGGTEYQSPPYVTAIGIGSDAGYTSGTAVGNNVKIYGYGGIAIGASITDYGDDNIAIGGNCGTENDTVEGAIQLGSGTNTISNSLCVGGNYNLSTSEYDNWELLDRTTGKIPNDRINTMVGATTLTGGSAGLVPAPSAGDEDKFLKADGTWDTVGGGGGSYTAGTGIDITNDTISVDDTIFTTDTVQTVTEAKTFNADIHLNGGDIKLDSTTSYIQGKVSDNVYRNIIARSVSGSEITIGNQGDTLRFAGKLQYPKYNNVDMALLTDIPTVNNPTITFTQGGVTKGTITLNQSGNATIAFDAGGSGGGAVDSVNGQTGTVVLTASDVGALPSTTVIPTKTSDLTNDSGYITNSALSGYATETWVGNQGYITSITSSDVTTALGYTPYNSTNPNGYITSADLPTNYVTTNTAQTITGLKTFSGSIKTDTVYNTNSNPILQIYNSTIRVGNSNYGLKLLGDSTRPEYSMDGGSNYNQLALLADVPTITLREWS